MNGKYLFNVDFNNRESRYIFINEISKFDRNLLNLEDRNTLIRTRRYILSFNRGRNVQFYFMMVEVYKLSNLEGRNKNNSYKFL